MKRKFLFSILAVIPAALMPLAATSQIVQERPRVERNEPDYKWEISAGYGYTSLNQVNQSRYGLQGVNVSVTRDWGRYFGVTADGAFYNTPLSSALPGNPGNPSVDAVFLGPVVHANLLGKTSLLIHALLGVEHTGGESMYPDISFAGGMGGGMEYKMSTHFALRATGDEIAASFVEDPNHLGYSPHMHWNSRAAFSVVYKF